MTLIHRFWHFVRRHPAMGCPFCGRLLITCPSCRGAWRETGCTRCTAGGICPNPSHGRWWLA